MRIISRTILRVTALAMALTCLTPASVRADHQLQSPQPDQAALAKQLLSQNREDRNRAFYEASSLESSAIEPVLRDALITLLHMQNRVVEQAAQRGVTVEVLEDPEFIGSVQAAVARLNDPKAISALAGSLDSGGVIYALSRFGEQAVPAVLAVVQSSTDHFAVDNGLRTLRWIVEDQENPLSAGARAQIRSATATKLRGKVYFSTLWMAIDLASSLQDPELMQIVADLAKNAASVAARGIDSEYIQKTQQRAAERIRGVRPVPRSVPPR